MEPPPGEPIFQDEGLTLHRILPGHVEELLAEGTLAQYADALVCGGARFPLSEIANMAMVKANILLFSRGDDYYEIRTGGEVCLRKYLLYRQSRA